MGAPRRRRGNDVVLIHGVDPRRKELHVLRRRSDGVEAGVVRDVEEGRPIQGDLVKLKPWRDFPLVCDVETVLSTDETGNAQPSGSAGTGTAGASTDAAARAPARAPHPGPARVASDAYRSGWDRVFAGREPPDVN
ncbi:MAG: hypothetical protein FJ087_08945 [Deltaproteobacteria bacterium]|nr:hypothetical protein [Deltaproteobacteria bacterium]